PLAQKGQVYGLGKIGHLQKKYLLADFAHFIKEKLNVEQVRFSGRADKEIYKVAILGGSGEGYIPQAIAQNVDAYISGYFTLHHAQDAIEEDLALIDEGHYIEKIMNQPVAEYVAQLDSTLNVYVSKIN